MYNEPIFFTVLEKDGNETRLNITPDEDGVQINELKIDYQQLFELGILLAALAINNGQPDRDSAAELLDGYLLPCPNCLKEAADYKD